MPQRIKTLFILIGVLLFLGCEKKEELTFENLLYSDKITEESVCNQTSDTSANGYGCALYRRLNQKLSSLSITYCWDQVGLNRYEFVPEYVRPESVPPLTNCEQYQEYAATAILIEEFWRPWVNRLYGNEGAWYRVKVKSRTIGTGGFSPGKGRNAYRVDVDELLAKAAEGKDPEGLFLYGIIRFKLRDRTVVRHPEEGWPALLEAADLGWPEACYEVGLAYYYGMYVEKDIKRAEEYFKAALDKGFFIAAGGLSQLLLDQHKETGEPIDQGLNYYYSLLARGPADVIGLTYARLKVDDPQVAAEVEERVLAYVKMAREKKEQEQIALQQRWNTLVPEIKQAMYRDIPWLVWTVAPEEMREQYRREFLKTGTAHWLDSRSE